jgi:hypothetical protein
LQADVPAQLGGQGRGWKSLERRGRRECRGNDGYCQVGDDEVRRHLRQKGAGTVAEDEGVGGVGRGGYLEG